MTTEIELEATYLRDGRYAVRPKGQLGTCGFHPVAWTVSYVKANSPEQAIAKTKAAANPPAKRYQAKQSALSPVWYVQDQWTKTTLGTYQTKAKAQARARVLNSRQGA